MTGYRPVKTVGEGSFSTVVLMENAGGERLVEKRFKPGFASMARQEYLFLLGCAGPGVVTTLGWDQTGDGVLLLEYIEGTSPVSSLFTNQQQVWACLAEIAAILARIHSRGICYNDLKPGNILMRDGKPVILDFGLATLHLRKDAFRRLTPAYAAPEKLRPGTNHFSGDVFSLGLLALELTSGLLPADDLGNIYTETLLDHAKWNAYLDSRDISPTVRQLLHPEAQARPTVGEVALAFAREAGIGQAIDMASVVETRIFEAHIGAARQLTTTGHLGIRPGEDLDKILHLVALEMIQDRQEIHLIDEQALATGAEDLPSELDRVGAGASSPGDDSHPDIPRLILKRKPGVGLHIIDELQHLPHVLTITEDPRTDPLCLTASEVGDLVALPGFDPAIARIVNEMACVSVSALRKLLRPGTFREQTEIESLLSALAMPVDFLLLEKLFSGWQPTVVSALAEGRARLVGDRVEFTGPAPDALAPFFDDAYRVAVEEGYLDVAARIAYLNNDETSAVRLAHEHVSVLIRAERYAGALMFLEWIRGGIPDERWNPPLTKRYAYLLRKAGRGEQSLSVYHRAISKSTGEDRAVLLGDAAVVMTETGAYDAAVSAYEEAVDIFRKAGATKALIRMKNNLGVLHYQLGQYKKAQLAFNDVISLTGDKDPANNYHLLACYNLAEVFLRTGQWSKSLYYARKLLSAENGTPRFSVPAQTICLASLFAEGRFDALPKMIADLSGTPGLPEDTQTYSAALADWLYILRFTPTANSDSLVLAAREVENPSHHLVLELFCHHWFRREYLPATHYRNQISDPTDRLFAEALCDGREESVLARVRQCVDEDNIWDALRLLTHIAGKPGLEASIRREIANLTRVYPFAPLEAFVANSGQVSPPPQLTLLWEVIGIIHGETDFLPTLKAVLSALLKVSRLHRAVFFQLEYGRFEPLLALDDKLGEISLRGLKVSNSILSETAALGEIRFLTGMQDDTDMKASILGLGLRTAVCCPLAVDGETIGVIYADATADWEFNADDKQLITAIITQSRAAIGKNLQLVRLRQNQSPDDYPRIMIGNGPAMQRIHELIVSVGRHNVNVIIQGETGTGKEMVARSLHDRYNPKAPFVAMNCAAIPETLLESELFGYARGAFTGAVSARKGKIEMAAGGTLFLDEIGDMPVNLQAKLLRVLQERAVTPVGETKSIRVDFRVICATHRDLEHMVQTGVFRSDLLYRLRVVEIKLPPLKDRREDIPVLAHHFTKKHAVKFGKTIEGIDLSALRYLQSLPYPGNVRELENLIERAVVLSDKTVLTGEFFAGYRPEPVKVETDDLPGDWETFQAFKRARIQGLERAFAKQLLSDHGGNHSRAARAAGMSRVQLYRILSDDT